MQTPLHKSLNHWNYLQLHKKNLQYVLNNKLLAQTFSVFFSANNVRLESNFSFFFSDNKNVNEKINKRAK